MTRYRQGELARLVQAATSRQGSGGCHGGSGRHDVRCGLGAERQVSWVARGRARGAPRGACIQSLWRCPGTGGRCRSARQRGRHRLFRNDLGARAGGREPFDYVTINLDGISAEVVDLSSLGPPRTAFRRAEDACRSRRRRSARSSASRMDNAPQPNIYLAATSAYGLSIYLPDGSGAVRRIRVGDTRRPVRARPVRAARDHGGSPGSIWRVDGVTGEAFLFANDRRRPRQARLARRPCLRSRSRSSSSSPIAAPAIIHRFRLDGYRAAAPTTMASRGGPPAGLSPLPYSPAPRSTSIRPSFTTDSPSTWGFAPPGRRVFALAVRRAAASTTPSPRDRRFGRSASARAERSRQAHGWRSRFPALQDGIEIASITFDGAGRMYLAERGPVERRLRADAARGKRGLARPALRPEAGRRPGARPLAPASRPVCDRPAPA